MTATAAPYCEAVIEWHDYDNEIEIELSPPMTRKACIKWLHERVDLSTMGTMWEGQLKMAPVDEEHRITDGMDGERWAYYWVRPSAQIALPLRRTKEG